MKISDIVGDVSTWEVMITTVAAALTPFIAFKYREKRAKRPKTPQEALYRYYENYIDRLEQQILKKDKLIEVLEVQNREQRDTYEKIIDDLEGQLRVQRNQLKLRQEEINQLKNEIKDIRSNSQLFRERIRKIKSENPEVLDSKPV